MNLEPVSATNRPKAFLFDVFGTVVDWRSSINDYLAKASSDAVNRHSSDISDSVPIAKAKALRPEDWAKFSQEWRTCYHQFTQGFKPEEHEGDFPTVDEHMLSALREILARYELTGLWRDVEVEKPSSAVDGTSSVRTVPDIAQIWHALRPWPDSAKGIELLNDVDPKSGQARNHTSTLSNGNTSLLSDLRSFGSLPFTDLLSAETFGAYKPHPRVYLGAAKALGLEPGECAMVAAHLRDIKAARECGFRTIYVERKDEEDVSEEQIERMKRDGSVDIWVTLEQEGFIEVARQLGLESES